MMFTVRHSCFALLRSWRCPGAALNDAWHLGIGSAGCLPFYPPHRRRAAGSGTPDQLLAVFFMLGDMTIQRTRLRAHGAELLGEVAQYESIFRLCYLRGPAGIIVALAEQIG